MNNTQSNSERIEENQISDYDDDNKQQVILPKENDLPLNDFAELSLNKENEIDHISSPECPLQNNLVNEERTDSIKYVNYCNETQMPDIMRLIQKDLSEPYSIYTYRYFIHNWPQLCFLVRKIDDNKI